MKLKAMLVFLLMIVLSALMAVPAFAALEISYLTCSVCGGDFGVDPTMAISSVYYTDELSVEEIPGITSDTSLAYYAISSDEPVYVVYYNNKNLCFDCLKQLVNKYKASKPTVGSTTSVDATTGAADIPITVVRDAPTFSVTVPTSMPIAVGADGKVTTAEDVTIENNGSQAICVKSIAINAATDWSLAKYDKAAMQAEAVDSKKIGFLMTIGSQTAATTIDGKSETIGSYATSDITISPSSRLTISYDGVIPAQSIDISSNTQVANVVFTLDWAV